MNALTAIVRRSRALYKSVDAPNCLLIEECGKSLPYLISRHVFLAGCDEPDVAERVFQFTAAVAVELVLHWLQYFRPGVVSLANYCVRIFDVNVNLHRCSAERLGAAMPVFQILTCQHYHRASNSELGVPDLPARFCQPVDLHRSEGFFVKLNGGGRVVNTQVRRRAFTTIRNRFHFACHKYSPLC